jgi:opacity protein-like surface antigen
MGQRLFLAATVCFVGLICSNPVALAAEVDPARVLEKLAALEARVASLESENRDYRRRLAHVQAQPAVLPPAGSERTSALAGPFKAPPPADIHAPPSPGWTGVFWGASAGGAATRSATSSVERSSIASPGFLSGNNASDISGPTSGAGGFIDVFSGANVQFSRFVIGGQLEATISDMNFGSSGTRSYTYFDQNGPTGMTATGNYRPQITSRWMGSALLRAGVLLDADTLLYGLGGWTFAQFEARNVTDNPFYQPNETLWANGPTAGVGIERNLHSNWRVRAEYRYTKFDAAHDQNQFQFSSGTSSETYSRLTQFGQSMQSGRIGFAYAFDPLQ